LKINDIIEPIAAEMREVEARVRQQIGTPTPIIQEMLSHTIGAGGKRLRPALCLLSARAVGSVTEEVITLGAQIELIHTVTLIHDDVVDNAPTRRGQPTANAKWGNEMSVLVGDYVFARIFESLTQNGHLPWTHLLARTSAQMSEGELQQIHFRRNVHLSEEQYLEQIRLKTAELMSAACQAGAMAAGATPAQLRALRDFGLNFGLAFQITDDLLDVVASDETLGKPTGNDLREGKITLPLIHALRSASSADRNRICSLISRGDLSGQEVQEIIAFVLENGGDTYCRQKSREFTIAARESLSVLDDSPARRSLASLADALVDRKS